MIPEKILINLKIISKIQKNGKITKSHDGIVSLETQKYLQSFKRFLYGDSRTHTLCEINSIINESIAALDALFNSKVLVSHFNSQEYYIICQDIKLLINELQYACKGIQNLKFTYIKDLNVTAKLDVYIRRITNTIRDSIIKFSYYSTEVVTNFIIIDDETQSNSQAPEQKATPVPIPEPKANTFSIPTPPEVKSQLSQSFES